MQGQPIHIPLREHTVKSTGKEAAIIADKGDATDDRFMGLPTR